MNELRVILGVASGGTPAAPFIAALARLKLPDNVAQLQRSVVIGNYVPAQREMIINDAIDEGFDYLFFVDDDMVLPERALELLVGTAEADPTTAVVGGLYYTRDSMRPVTVADWNSTDTSGAHIPAFTSTSTGVVDGIGFGCALLRISAAKKLSAPYFPSHVFIERAARRVRQCNEDYLYCERVRKAGYTVRLDARVRCPHYDRASDSVAPLTWEGDDATSIERMMVEENGVTQLVPFNDAVPRMHEHHVRGDLTYISVD